jgi:hypothetical protein
VGVAPEDRAKTSFVTGVKQFEWRVMPFGLTPGAYRGLDLGAAVITSCQRFMFEPTIALTSALIQVLKKFEANMKAGWRIRGS